MNPWQPRRGTRAIRTTSWIPSESLPRQCESSWADRWLRSKVWCSPENETRRSLKALKAYNTGYRTIFGNDYPGPIPLFERAIGLDARVAMAYARLGINFYNMDQIRMVQAHLGTEVSEVIVDQIRSNPENYVITSSILIQLEQEGVPDADQLSNLDHHRSQSEDQS